MPSTPRAAILRERSGRTSRRTRTIRKVRTFAARTASWCRFPASGFRGEPRCAAHPQGVRRLWHGRSRSRDHRCQLQRAERRRWSFPGPDLHWDVSLKTPIPLGMQGLLFDRTPPEQGASRWCQASTGALKAGLPTCRMAPPAQAGPACARIKTDRGACGRPRDLASRAATRQPPELRIAAAHGAVHHDVPTHVEEQSEWI